MTRRMDSSAVRAHRDIQGTDRRVTGFDSATAILASGVFSAMTLLMAMNVGSVRQGSSGTESGARDEPIPAMLIHAIQGFSARTAELAMSVGNAPF